MELLNRKKTGKVERPVKVLQFGEGNFLRAFVDYKMCIRDRDTAVHETKAEVENILPSDSKMQRQDVSVKENMVILKKNNKNY